MHRVVTIRLSDQDYKKILTQAESERRPISNFVIYTTLKHIEECSYVDAIEMAQIKEDKKLIARLKKGHLDAKKMRGRFAG